MKALIIDSSEKQANIGLINEEKIINYKMDEGKSHSQFLLKDIENLLIENNLELKNLDYLSVNVGPGSFTGVRIGLSFVKAFMCVLNVKTVVINNFEIINKNILNKNSEYFVLISSNNEEFYYAHFKNDKINYGYSNLEEFNNVINSNKLNVYCLKEELEEFKGVNNITGVLKNDDSFIKVSIDKINKKEFYDINEISPLYIKKSQAEQGLQLKIDQNLELRENTKIEELVKLESLCFDEENYSEKSLLDDINNENRKQFFAYYNNELIGYINFETILNEASLFKICVLNEFRNYKVGSKLMQKMIDYCKEKGINKVFLEVDNKNNPAIKLYGKFNFYKISERKNYYKNGDNAIIYQLDL